MSKFDKAAFTMFKAWNVFFLCAAATFKAKDYIDKHPNPTGMPFDKEMRTMINNLDSIFLNGPKEINEIINDALSDTKDKTKPNRNIDRPVITEKAIREIVEKEIFKTKTDARSSPERLSSANNIDNKKKSSKEV